MALATEEPCVTETFPELETEKSNAGASTLQIVVSAALLLLDKYARLATVACVSRKA